jgi:hypothetical protein
MFLTVHLDIHYKLSSYTTQIPCFVKEIEKCKGVESYAGKGLIKTYFIIVHHGVTQENGFHRLYKHLLQHH